MNDDHAHINDDDDEHWLICVVLWFGFLLWFEQTEYPKKTRFKRYRWMSWQTSERDQIPFALMMCDDCLVVAQHKSLSLGSGVLGALAHLTKPHKHTYTLPSSSQPGVLYFAGDGFRIVLCVLQWSSYVYKRTHIEVWTSVCSDFIIFSIHGWKWLTGFCRWLQKHIVIIIITIITIITIISIIVVGRVVSVRGPYEDVCRPSVRTTPFSLDIYSSISVVLTIRFAKRVLKFFINIYIEKTAHQICD